MITLGGIKTILIGLLLVFLFIAISGLLWLFLGPGSPVGFGWYLFSFAAGLSMIVLPCTLPLAFVIVPLSMGKGPLKGLGMAISFGIGVAIMLSLYGVLAAVLGGVVIGTVGASLETVKNWLYLIAGLFAYIFALGQIGLVKFRMPSYTGAAPSFIQKQQDYIKALLLGLFLGNVGVGCPHPATPVIFTRIAASGDVWYGWLLFFIHAIGRILPLLILAILGILGVNALKWVVARKDKVENFTGWAMVFVAGFILVLGLFTHDWWVYSGQHTTFESITQEERFLSIISKKIGVDPPHTHEIPQGVGLFGLALWLGNWVLVFLWILPIWWNYFRMKNRAGSLEEKERIMEERASTYRFWIAILSTLFLSSLFIYILPDRFLYHGQVNMHDNKEKEAGDSMGDDMAMNLKYSPMPILQDQMVRFDFLISRKDNGEIVDDLEVAHEKYFHLIGVRDDLEQFFHVHPSRILPGLFSAEYKFSAAGTYKMWSEVKKEGETYIFEHPGIVVGNGFSPAVKKNMDYSREYSTKNLHVFLDYDSPIVKNKEKIFKFSVHDDSGNEVKIDNFLGEKMHVLMIKEDLTVFQHLHLDNDMHKTDEMDDDHGLIPAAEAHGEKEEPSHMEDMMASQEYSLAARFQDSGKYKIFLQFKPSGYSDDEFDAILASFWINVDEGSLKANRITLVVLTLIIILLLSFGVFRYLKV